MVDSDSIGQRLRERREALGLSQTEMADAVLAGGARGATRQSQSKYEKGERLPDAGYLAVADGLGIDVLYVLTGRREQKPEPLTPVSSDTTRASGTDARGALLTVEARPCLLAPADVSVDRPMTLPVRFAAGESVREYQVIPRFQAAAAAGRLGARSVDGESLRADVAGVLAVECEYMRRALGRDGPGFVTVTVAGDSMEPTLGDGDVIIVDTAQTAIDASGIYVVELAGDLLVKRVQRRMDGSVVLKSDNPAYDPEHIQAAAVQSLRVLGRMTRLRFR